MCGRFSLMGIQAKYARTTNTKTAIAENTSVQQHSDTNTLERPKHLSNIQQKVQKCKMIFLRRHNNNNNNDDNYHNTIFSSKKFFTEIMPKRLDAV